MQQGGNDVVRNMGCCRRPNRFAHGIKPSCEKAEQEDSDSHSRPILHLDSARNPIWEVNAYKEEGGNKVGKHRPHGCGQLFVNQAPEKDFFHQWRYQEKGGAWKDAGPGKFSEIDPFPAYHAFKQEDRNAEYQDGEKTDRYNLPLWNPRQSEITNGVLPARPISEEGRRGDPNRSLDQRGKYDARFRRLDGAVHLGETSRTNRPDREKREQENG